MPHVVGERYLIADRGELPFQGDEGASATVVVRVTATLGEEVLIVEDWT